MILVSFGSPSAIAYAATDIVRQAMARCIGAHSLLQVVRLDDFEDKWRALGEEGRRAVLVVSDCPHVDVIDRFSAADGPILVSCDSFEHIVGYVRRSRRMEFAPAVRFATQVMCALDALSATPNVMQVTPEHYGQDLSAFTASLVDFTGLSCSTEQFEGLIADLSAGHAGPRQTFRHYVERHFPHFSDDDDLGLPAEDRASLDALMAPYGSLARGRGTEGMVWPTRLFLDWDRPGRFLERRIELMGPARFIVCGPYLHLPRGRWRMSIAVETQACLSDNRLGADIFSGRILSAVTMRLPARGHFGFDLDFEVTDALLPVELRVQLLTGAIEGSLRLLEVRLSRTSRVDMAA